MTENAEEKRLGTNGRGSHRPSARQLYDDTRRVGDELSHLAGDVREALSNVEAVARDGLAQRPYVTLAVAAGIGYVLGGGLPAGAFRLAFGILSRLAVERALAQVAPRP